MRACLTAKMKKKGNQSVDQLSSPESVITNATSSQCEVYLNIFEDSETVIKMIIKRTKSCEELR